MFSSKTFWLTKAYTVRYYTLLSVKCIQIYKHSTVEGCADVRRLVMLSSHKGRIYRMDAGYMRYGSVTVVWCIVG